MSNKEKDVKEKKVSKDEETKIENNEGNKVEEKEINEEVIQQKPKFPILLFLGTLFLIAIGMIVYQTNGHYGIAYIPNKQIDSMLEETNKDRSIRLSIHSEDERMAFLITEKQREKEYEGQFHLQLTNSKGEYNFDSEYYTDTVEDVLMSGFYKKYIKLKNTDKIKLPEIQENIVKYALLGERENVTTPNGIETTFKHKLNENELGQIVLLKDFSFKNTLYDKWYKSEDEVRTKLMPDSDKFPDFRGSIEEFLLSTDLDNAVLYATFLDNKLLTWGIDFDFSYKDSKTGEVLKEWKVYLDLTYTENDSKIKRDKLDIINSTDINSVTPDVYNFEENPYLNYEGESSKKEENIEESDIGELDITIEELDKMLMNGSGNIKLDKKGE